MNKEQNKDIERTHAAPTFLPEVDIYEYKDGLVVEADMPGADEKNINVDFQEGILKISGQVRPHNIGSDYKCLYREYKYGDYERSFSVPEEIDIEKIEATMKNGVLTIKLPRSPKPEARKIPISFS